LRESRRHSKEDRNAVKRSRENREKFELMKRFREIDEILGDFVLAVWWGEEE
jgi:hypothetical protein